MNVLVYGKTIKNFIYVRQFTTENHVSSEFDHFVFLLRILRYVSFSNYVTTFAISILTCHFSSLVLLISLLCLFINGIAVSVILEFLSFVFLFQRNLFIALIIVSPIVKLVKLGNIEDVLFNYFVFKTSLMFELIHSDCRHLLQLILVVLSF